MHQQINKAVTILQDGGVIAYPTEAVYGLGCDPFNEKAVRKILEIKKRSVEKGLILIAASWEQIKFLTEKIPEEKLNTVLATWPGPFTWVFPASNKVPFWIRGAHNSIALRVTNHSIARLICEKFGPIVSTSANLTQQSPATTTEEVEKYFADKVDLIIPGQTGGLKKTTSIMDVLTGKKIRE